MSKLSLENLLFLLLVFPLILLIVLILFLFNSYNLNISAVAAGLVFLISFYTWFAGNLYNRILSIFFRLANEIELIDQDTYGSSYKYPFVRGISAQIFEEIQGLKKSLKAKNKRYNEHGFLIYKLIEQLASPVAVLDHKKRLIHGNQAFSDFKGVDWRTIRLHSASDLGLLEMDDGSWRIAQEEGILPRGEQDIQIRSSQFRDDKTDHWLLVFTDISGALGVIQRDSWKRLLRVLGHEINNSLTPVVSLTQTLKMREEDKDRLEILNVISRQVDNLKRFVKAYSDLYKGYSINKELCNTEEFFSAMEMLFPNLTIEYEIEVVHIEVDVLLFKQVITNLLKNAEESISISQGAQEGKKNVNLKVLRNHIYVIIQIIDSGVGIQNKDNLFVPFYTTKPEGQGIGLSFCKNIVELHGGCITLENRQDASGAVATIYLPNARSKTKK